MPLLLFVFLGEKNMSWPTEELAESVNEQIRERTSYGVRTEVAERRGFRMMWSNGAARWMPFGVVPKGHTMQLDANEVFVPGATRRGLEQLIDMGALIDLPLYGGSFERRQAGTPDYSGVELPPAIKVIRDTDWLREEAVDNALGRKGEES